MSCCRSAPPPPPLPAGPTPLCRQRVLPATPAAAAATACRAQDACHPPHCYAALSANSQLPTARRLTLRWTFGYHKGKPAAFLWQWVGSALLFLFPAVTYTLQERALVGRLFSTIPKARLGALG